jgi:hypothetical protein
MIPAILVGPLRIPELGAGPALTLPATVSWAGPSAKTITAANVAQPLAPARAGRKGWFVQNFSNTDMWVDDTATPVPNECICVPAGSEYCIAPHMVTGGELKILCALAGAKFCFREGY